MIYRRKTYTIDPNSFEAFTQFFHEYLLPNQLGHGARLIGRYVTLDHKEIMALWEYDSFGDYEAITNKIRQSELHEKAQKRRKELGDLFIESKEDFLESTGEYHFTKHIVSVSAFITNERGEVLLIRNEHRADTWELPGGRMETGETLKEAIQREVLEETGAEVQITGMTGVYHNLTRGIVCMVFKGEYQSGELTIQPGETSDVCFQTLTEENMDKLVTREAFRVRITDAMNNEGMSVESYYVRPYDLIHRMEI
ncbi:NUDIX domain-containing protein [Halobacillus rhizosphaerae]|uniref:NUDIX domain-containing protein n=1 Tax=Halobacillus rhizosphaerae TaxID=3064889 RepID=UPI00398B1EEC